VTARAVLISLLAGLGLGAALLATLAVAAFAGSPEAADAWLVALAVSQFLIGAMQAGAVTAAMPAIAGETPHVQAGRTRVLCLAIALPAALLAALLALTAAWWMRLLAPGLSAEPLLLATALAREQLAALPLAGAVLILSVRGQSAGAALAVEAAGAAASLLFVAALVLLIPRAGIAQAGWLVPARWAVNAALLAGFMRGGTWPADAAGVVRGVARKFTSFAAFGALYQSAVVVDRFLLSFAAPGTVSAYAIVSGVVLAGASVLERGLTAPSLPRLFDDAKRGDLASLRARQLRLQRLAGLAGLAAAVALGVLGLPLLRLAGDFVPLLATRADESWRAALLLAPCLAAVPAGAVAAAALNARGHARVLLRVILGAWVASLIAKAVGFSLVGVPGVAAGTSLYFVAGFIALDRRAARA
jgi:O-antigen/teichoic acid export membrane protein